jgi:carboxyl-terminal processing protease
MGFKKKLILLFILISIGSVVYGQTSICDRAKQIVDTLNKNHYAPRPLDEKFSEYVFDYFIEAIDNQQLIFSKEDYDHIVSYRDKLSVEILEKNCSFIDTINSIYYARLNEIKTIIEQLNLSKINFNTKDSILFAKERIFYSEKNKLSSWNNFIKVQVLYDHFSQRDSGSTDDISTQTIEKAIQTQICIIDAEIKDNAFVYNSYLNAIAKAFDPHSSYFTYDDKGNFDYGLSKETKSFGIEITKNDLEKIEIAELIPGGPAWKSNLLNESDIILSVSNKNERKSFVCITLQEAYNFINSPDYNTLTFEVAKKNGHNRTVKLTKEELEVTNNIIQSYVLLGEKKIGYIYLPSFYSEMDYGSYYLPNGCANDISKELFKLKREGIEGLIIDVRNNGGGSMLEAVRLSGVFIDYGAIAIIDNKEGKPQTLKDMDRGVAFSKPLVIMVNESSASASEFFASAMQDQNRGVVVGSKTFGKSTMQMVKPLNSKDFLKTTTGKFYRVTGKSHQKIGVIPDIKLPSYYSKMNITEGMYASAIENTFITHKTYYYPFKELPLENLKALSKIRVDTNAYFKNIEAVASFIHQKANRFAIPLNYDQFSLFYKQKELEYESLDSDFKNTIFVAHNPVYLSDINDKTETEKIININNIENIEEDIFISESYNVIIDLINNK